jgi:hypothetical protein
MWHDLRLMVHVTDFPSPFPWDQLLILKIKLKFLNFLKKKKKKKKKRKEEEEEEVLVTDFLNFLKFEKPHMFLVCLFLCNRFLGYAGQNKSQVQIQRQRDHEVTILLMAKK